MGMAISINFNDNNFGCGTKKCMRAGDEKQLYYKSWPNVNIAACNACVRDK